MHPHLAYVPVWLFALLMGGAAGASFGKSTRASVVGGVVGALIAGLVAYFLPMGQNRLPVQGYGVMILLGFVTAVAVAEWRVQAIGIKRYHVLDMGLTGCALGILFARIFYVAMTWQEFTPFTDHGFDTQRIAKMFYIWEGGLVFYGAFLVAIPWGYYYCRKHKLPAIPFVDACAPGLILGQAFGRIGCFMTGCCYGRVCDYLPWAVHFPGRGPTLAGEIAFGAPAFEAQVRLNQISQYSPASLPVHPTQLYASLAGFLTYAFLMAYWPRRRYDGQVLALTLIMAGSTRFFEELLRYDDAPPLPSISEWMTIAQWVAIAIVALGIGLMSYFRRKRTLYVPAHVEPAVQTEQGRLIPS
jgi:phosphatidylglycerol:prolipoprotein diacylglycerol transferase